MAVAQVFAQVFCIWGACLAVGLSSGLLAMGHDPVAWSCFAAFNVGSVIVNSIGLAKTS